MDGKEEREGVRERVGDTLTVEDREGEREDEGDLVGVGDCERVDETEGEKLSVDVGLRLGLRETLIVEV